MQTFESFGLSEGLLAALDKKGFKAPSPVQNEVIPILLNSNDDIIVQAQTGTGKTAAFGLPLCHTIQPLGLVRALILAPTRELAVQVCNEIQSFGSDLKVLPVYGGQPFSEQKKALKRGVDIVVGTPGRVIEAIEKEKLIMDHIEYVVLDEVDEMLNMGFIEDVEFVLDAAPDDCQRLMFSATLSPRLEKTAHGYLDKPKKVKVETCESTRNLIDHVYYEADKRNRLESLTRILAMEEDFYGIIFCQRKAETETLASELTSHGISAEYLHGDIAQQSRETILNRFRNRKCQMLIATDVAARGIDITDLTHVINYSVPESAEAYTHRCGRTGRRGKKGTALTLVISSDMGRLKRIRNITKFDMQKKQVPAGDVIAKARFELFKTKLETLSPSESSLELADTLLSDKEPKEVLAAILQHYSNGTFDPNSYKALAKSGRDRGERGGRDRGERGGRERGERGGRERGERGGRERGERGGRERGERGGRERGERGERGGRDRGERGGRERGERGERKEFSFSGDETKVRLEKGLNDDFSGRDIVRFIESKGSIPRHLINNLNLKRQHCTFTVPEKDAKFVVNRLNKRIDYSGKGTVSVILDRKQG